jgi:flagellar basal body rod protein FlgC
LSWLGTYREREYVFQSHTERRQTAKQSGFIVMVIVIREEKSELTAKGVGNE